jgi:hypothetical protein
MDTLAELDEMDRLRAEVAGLRLAAERATETAGRAREIMLLLVACSARPEAVAQLRDHQLTARERAAIAWWQRPGVA